MSRQGVLSAAYAGRNVTRESQYALVAREIVSFVPGQVDNWNLEALPSLVRDPDLNLEYA